uniref:Amino acid permease/ SLC12A domain-containing protein n=1 Tax=Caenorhabditis japonica TaxID=281687 RepID=A0A8R1DM51_CAEJA
MASLWKALSRRKKFEGDSHLDTNLRRCLGLLDITFLALGQMMGAGIYVLTGTVVRNQAGPSIVFSFMLAGAAALLSAFSYAEFGARFPRAGSAYTYTYIGFGELWAFIVGWTVPLEYMIGNAAVARSWSAYFDNLLDNYVRNTTIGLFGEMGARGGFFSTYPDIMSFILICLCSCVIAIGSKVSANVNTSFVVLNIVVIIIVIVSGLSYADITNWTGTTADGLHSNFLPFGTTGTLTGAATCFFSYIGFEVLASAGEEVKSPHRTIPIATFLSIGIIMTLYILVSSTLTLMIPYDQ